MDKENDMSDMYRLNMPTKSVDDSRTLGSSSLLVRVRIAAPSKNRTLQVRGFVGFF